MNYITEIDFLILDFLQSFLRCEPLDVFFSFITHLGDSGLIWIITGILMTVSKKYRRCGIMMLCGMLFGFLTGNLIMKPVIARSRPCWINDAVNTIISVPQDFSFPSGHTLSSVISCTVIGLHYRRFLIIALPITVLIAFSRLYLYVHFPTDVLFGTLYGLIIGIVFYRISERYFKKQSER